MKKNKNKTTSIKQQNNKSRFENWYFRLVDAKKEHALGILIGRISGAEESEAFIQITGLEMQDNIYLSYPAEAFKHSDAGILIEENQFGSHHLVMDIHTEDCKVKGEITFNQHRDLKQSFWRPGLMGPYKYLPFLKSYYEVISLQNYLIGSLTINERTICFNEGKGYIEKDWGKEQAKIWVWAECNHFKKHDLSVMLGIARLPVFFNYYTCFVIPVLHHDKLDIFSNYNGGHIAKLYRYKGYVHLIVIQKNKILDIKIYGSDEISCVPSRSSHSIRDVYACNEAKIEIKMTEDREVILEEMGNLCEIELGGNTSKLK